MSANERFLKTGQFLFKEGEPSQSLFLVKNGTIAIQKTKGSEYVELAKVYSNEIIGELSFFDRQPRSAAAVAISDSTVVEIDFVSLDKIYSSVPPYMKTIMAAMAERLRKTNDAVKKLQKSAPIENSTPHKDNDGELAAILAATSDSSSNSENSD